MADDEKPRNYDQFSVEDKGKLQAAHERAKAIKERQAEPQQKQVSQDRQKFSPDPAPKLQPKMKGAQDVDRQAHNERLQKAKTEEKQKLDAARQRAESVKIEKEKQNVIKSKDERNKGRDGKER